MLHCGNCSMVCPLLSNKIEPVGTKVIGNLTTLEKRPIVLIYHRLRVW